MPRANTMDDGTMALWMWSMEHVMSYRIYVIAFAEWWVTAVDPFHAIPHVLSTDIRCTRYYTYKSDSPSAAPRLQFIFIGLRWAEAYVYDEFLSFFEFDISVQ